MLEFVKSFFRARSIGGRYWTNFIGLDTPETKEAAFCMAVSDGVIDEEVVAIAYEHIIDSLRAVLIELSDVQVGEEYEEQVEEIFQNFHDLTEDYNYIVKTRLEMLGTQEETEEKLRALMFTIGNRISSIRAIERFKEFYRQQDVCEQEQEQNP